MRGTQNSCPVCGEGQLAEKIGLNFVEYKDQSTQLKTVFSVCDTCGSEQANAAQLRINKRAMVAFKKQVDKLLTGVQVRALRESFGISQADASKAFGGGPVAFSKYENDDVAQSEALDKLLRLADAVPAALFKLLQDAGIERRQQYTRYGQVNLRHPARVQYTSRVISTSQPEPDSGWRKAG